MNGDNSIRRRDKINKIGQRAENLLFTFITLFIVSLLLAYPQKSFKAALHGIDTWLKIVFPSLLPFLIGAEVMMGMGLLDFFSVLLSPIMGPLFGCPGSSSFIWTMSAVSGYPMGAKLVSGLINNKKIDKIQGQRILSFCSTSGPLFMVGAVGVGMLGSMQAGKIILMSHYISAIILGISYKFYRSKDIKNADRPSIKSSNIFSEAINRLDKARKHDGRSIGLLLGDSVRNSVNTLLVIGGFIILYSVIISLLTETGIIQGLSFIFQPLVKNIGIDEDLVLGLTSGIFEMTVGCKLVSQSVAHIYQKIIVISFLIGWSGFSIHSQVASFISNTDISIGLYIFTKLIHGILSCILSWIMIKITYGTDIAAFSTDNTLRFSNDWRDILGGSCKMLIFTILGMIIFIIAFNIIYKSYKTIKDKKM